MTGCPSSRSPRVSIFRASCAATAYRGTTSSSTKWNRAAPFAPTAGSSSNGIRAARTSSTTCRATRTSASTSTASLTSKRRAPNSTTASPPSTSSTPILNTTSGTAAARKPLSTPKATPGPIHKPLTHFLRPMKSVFITLALLVSASLVTAADTRPNILIFVADDLGWADVPWHGSPYNMPNLLRLAENSLKLECHYVHPMCSPTRSALMTGRYASRFGVTGAQNPRCLPWNTVTLATALRSGGYETAITGKWHLGSKPDEGPQKFGFDHGYGSLAGGCGPLDHRYKEGEFTRTWHRNGKLIDEEGHITALIAREAVQWLEGPGEQPFFLYVPFTAIHVPMLESEKWRQVNAHLTDPAQRLRAACALHMDDAIGQVLAVLERKKLRENTLVLFFGDNGAHPPDDNQGGAYPGEYEHLMVGNDNKPLRGHKSGIYEGGIRTPGLASWRGKLTPGETQSPMHAVDWMPTLCALAGAKPDGDVKW